MVSISIFSCTSGKKNAEQYRERKTNRTYFKKSLFFIICRTIATKLVISHKKIKSGLNIFEISVLIPQM